MADYAKNHLSGQSSKPHSIFHHRTKPNKPRGIRSKANYHNIASHRRDRHFTQPAHQSMVWQDRILEKPQIDNKPTGVKGSCAGYTTLPHIPPSASAQIDYGIQRLRIQNMADSKDGTWFPFPKYIVRALLLSLPIPKTVLVSQQGGPHLYHSSSS